MMARPRPGYECSVEGVTRSEVELMSSKMRPRLIPLSQGNAIGILLIPRSCTDRSQPVTRR